MCNRIKNSIIVKAVSGLKLWITLTHDELTLSDLITEYVGCQSINCVFTVSGFCSQSTCGGSGGEEQAERKDTDH